MARIALPRIVIDTREQLPYEFIGYQTTIKGLSTGDYALEGYESLCAVERKSKSDAWGCVGTSRRRFEDCLRRLHAMQRSAVVIECELAEFCVPPARTRLTTAQAVGSYVSWDVQYTEVHWFPREYAERWTLRFLMAFYKHFIMAQSPVK